MLKTARWAVHFSLAASLLPCYRSMFWYPKIDIINEIGEVWGSDIMNFWWLSLNMTMSLLRPWMLKLLSTWWLCLQTPPADSGLRKQQFFWCDICHPVPKKRTLSHCHPSCQIEVLLLTVVLNFSIAISWPSLICGCLLSTCKQHS